MDWTPEITPKAYRGKCLRRFPRNTKTKHIIKEPKIMELFITFAILSACLCGFIAASKGRNSAAWAFGGAMGGIFAIIAICAVPAIEPEQVTSDKE